MAPILCDSLHSLVPRRTVAARRVAVSRLRPRVGRDVARRGRSITLIAAVDLAHIGPRFGDPWLVDATRRGAGRRADQELLELALAPMPRRTTAHVMRDRDARRICGFTPIYVLTALMEPKAAGRAAALHPVGRYRPELERDFRKRNLSLISVQEATRRANPGTWLPRPGHRSDRSRRPRQPAEQRTASVSLNHVEVAARRVKTS